MVMFIPCASSGTSSSMLSACFHCNKLCVLDHKISSEDNSRNSADKAHGAHDGRKISGHSRIIGV